MRIGLIIQARLNSKRLPGKILMDLGGRPLIWHLWHRLAELKLPIIIAVPEGEAAEISRAVRPREEVFFNEGPEDDVLARYHYAARGMALDAVIRVTGDCPLIAPEAIQRVLCPFQALYMAHPYMANDILASYPDGLGVEIFTVSALERAHIQADKAADREHVSPYMKRDKLNNPLNISCPINGVANYKLSIDTQEDLDFVRAIDAAQPRDFSLQATLEAVGRVKAQDHA